MYSCHFKGKRKLSGQQHPAQTSAAPPADCPIPPTLSMLDTLNLSWVPQPPPSPKHGQQGETGPTQETPSLTGSLSASAPSRLCLQPVQVYFYNLGKPNAGSTKIDIIHDGLHMTLSPFSQNTKLTISWHFYSFSHKYPQCHKWTLGCCLTRECSKSLSTIRQMYCNGEEKLWSVIPVHC